METIKDSLLEMGFSEAKAVKAIKATREAGLQQAMEWLIEHPSDDLSDNEEQSEDTAGDAVDAKSYKCDDCGKQLRNSAAIEFHSAKTGHVNFSESSEDVKPLTEEERKAQMEALNSKLQEKKTIRHEQERLDEIEQEKKRRQQGRVIGSAKEEFQQIEMRRFLEEQKRQKESDRLYKEELKAQIAQERAEKLARDRGELAAQPAKPAALPVARHVETDECKLQIRLPQGAPLVKLFKSNETLAAVRLYVAQNWPSGLGEIGIDRVILSSTYPKRDFTDDEMEQTLVNLNLCPASALMTRLAQQI